MILFFDTSALVKLFSNEPGSGKVKKLITDPSNNVWVLELALIEIQSAIFRKYRNNEFSEKKLEIVLMAVEKQFEDFTIIPFGSDIIQEAKVLIGQFGKEYSLRTLDALHVAGWNIVAESAGHFVSSDKNQMDVVKRMNHKVISV